MKTIYSSGCNILIFAMCIAASCVCQAASYPGDATSDAVDDVTKGNLDMLRLARGLQMLRLGKRLQDGMGPLEKVYSLRQLLQALITQPRDETRRQPPVPRYGRNLDSLEKAAKDLYLFPEVYRPAPRGGRYKRSLDAGDLNLSPLALSEFLLTSDHQEPISLRTVVRPRIGRYLGNLAPTRQQGSHSPRQGSLPSAEGAALDAGSH